jgi:creatinine amidohydrolase
VAETYDLMLLPPIIISYSQEHAGWRDTVWLRSSNLYSVRTDVIASLRISGVDKLLIVSGHGGNYVLPDVAQEASVDGRDVTVFPNSQDWHQTRLGGAAPSLRLLGRNLREEE